MGITAIPSINFIIKQTFTFCGIPIFLMGVIGGTLNIIVFLSLKTFRQSSCGFYLMCMSIFHLGRCFSSNLSDIMYLAFSTDWTRSSLIYCKIRVFLITVCYLSSMTCLCLGIIDQYFATSIHLRWHKWCNIKLAYCITGITVIIWSIHGIPYAIFYDHIMDISSNTTICQITNDKFIQYHVYGFFLILNNLLPLIAAIFGLLSYQNARNLAHRTVPLIRRELDKQLTVMVLVQVFITCSTFLPYSIESMFALTMKNSDPITEAEIKLATVITLQFSILSYTSPFYTYVCVSKRFRRQLKYVLFGIHFKRCRLNQIAPYPRVNEH